MSNVAPSIAPDLYEATVLESVLDLDSHEMTPSHLWGETFGESASRIAELVKPLLLKSGAHGPYNPKQVGDFEEITPNNVWNVRGTKAPGAFDFTRRVEVLDVMGIKRQLIFPTYGMIAMQLLGGSEHSMRSHMTLDGLTPQEIKTLGRSGMNEYNAWVIRTLELNPDRLRPVAYLTPESTVSELIAQAHDLITGGVRVLHLNTGTPPAGRSPAHPDLDPFWALLAERAITCTVHLGGEQDFVSSWAVWVDAPAFAPGKVESHEIGLEPYSFATKHFAVSNWLACMILGGVFERHPTLRFGVIESGSAWFGPLIDSFDMWARDVYATRLKPFISLLPSEYAARNVRVTPFADFERVSSYLQQYPHLQDCYCFSTDYPHVEGGKNSKQKWYEELAPMGHDVVERFFVKNAELLLPD